MHNLSILWTDAGGRTGILLLHLTDTAIATDGLGALLAGSNADWVQYWVGAAQVNAAPAPSSTAYAPLFPSATLLFRCADGSSARVRIPSPHTGLFLADGETVDPADPLGVIAALQAVITSNTGSSAAAFLGGVLEGGVT